MIDQGWLEYLQEDLELPRHIRMRLTVEGVKLVPVTPAHSETQTEIRQQIKNALSGYRAISEFRMTPRVENYNPEPDASAVPSALYRPGDPNYHDRDLPFVVEIISTESKARDYVTKADHYALRAIPSYLIVDVFSGAWQLLTSPHVNEKGAKYRTSQTGTFGDPITIPVGSTELVLDSSKFEKIAD